MQYESLLAWLLIYALNFDRDQINRSGGDFMRGKHLCFD